MTQKEFEELTDFKPSADCYTEYIEPAYIASKQDKQEWCRLWKQTGGIQKAYDWECLKVSEHEKKEAELTNRLNMFNDRFDRQETELSSALEENHRLRDANERLNAERIALAYYLIENAATFTPAGLCRKAADIIGAKAYLSYKIEKGEKLTDTDKAMLLEALR